MRARLAAYADRARAIRARLGLDWLSGLRLWLVVGFAAFGLVLLLAAYVWRDDIRRTGLDPKEPFQTYKPPRAPDYADPRDWALIPETPDAWEAGDLPVDVFFVHPTTYDGGRDWNGPLEDRSARRQLDRVMLPNYAGPFLRVGRIFAPRYRQASLYSQLTLRDDAREARRFAYGDVREAFRRYAADFSKGRDFIVVGVEQGGGLAARLIREEISADPDLAARMAAAYLIETPLPADEYGPQSAIPACARREQARCVVAWMSASVGAEDQARQIQARSLVWDAQGHLQNLGPRPLLCVNPITGAADAVEAPARLHMGAANASEVEWGARPAFLARQVSAQCVRGVLRVSEPKSASLRPSGGWADRKEAAPYNLFFADIEADARKRVATHFGRQDFPTAAPPIEKSVEIGGGAINRID